MDNEASLVFFDSLDIKPSSSPYSFLLEAGYYLKKEYFIVKDSVRKLEGILYF